MPLDREWSNRGGKPLVSVGIDGAKPQVGILEPCLEGFGTLIKRRLPNQLLRNLPMLGEV